MENLSWIVSIISIILGALAGWGAAAIKIGKYIQTVDDLKTKVSALEKDIKEHSNKLTECSTKIDERTQSYASTLTKRKSPVSLNENCVFFQAEDGIRDWSVTGVQTCALPIYGSAGGRFLCRSRWIQNAIKPLH